MEKYGRRIKDGLFALLVLVAALGISFGLQYLLRTNSLVSNVFILGVFLISLKTHGYFWGVGASLVSMLIVNFVFTTPYFAFDFMINENLPSAVIMLTISVMTGALTTKIKEQERTKSEIEKERMRANLLRAISHDLRTPLTTIYGSSSAVIENYDSLSKEQQLKLLGEVRQDSQWLIRMVENLLSVTRIDGDNAHVVKLPTVLEELVDTVLLKFRKRYPGQDVSVSIPEEFVSIPMDALLIEQVLINLLENAVLHARGMSELELTVEVRNGSAVFSVADNGCGIDADMLPGLFTGHMGKVGNQADSKRNNMGIGLSACATIIKAHGSEMRAKNRAGGGALFSFALPVEEGCDEQQ